MKKKNLETKKKQTEKQTNPKFVHRQLNNIIKPANLVDIYRAFNSAIAEYIFFKNQASVEKQLRQTISWGIKHQVEIIQSIFSDHNEIKLEIKNRKTIEIPSNKEIKQDTFKRSWIKKKKFMDQRGSLDRNNKKNRMTMKIQHIKMLYEMA